MIIPEIKGSVKKVEIELDSGLILVSTARHSFWTTKDFNRNPPEALRKMFVGENHLTAAIDAYNDTVTQ
jgi:hypothetical protein